jgi:hypothetical protein
MRGGRPPKVRRMIGFGCGLGPTSARGIERGSSEERPGLSHANLSASPARFLYSCPDAEPWFLHELWKGHAGGFGL